MLRRLKGVNGGGDVEDLNYIIWNTTVPLVVLVALGIFIAWYIDHKKSRRGPPMHVTLTPTTLIYDKHVRRANRELYINI